MKNSCYIVIIALLGLFSCKNSETENKSTQEHVNHLIPNKVSIMYEQSMIVPEEYWFFKGIDFQKFVSDLQSKTVSGKLSAFFPLSSIPLTKQDIQDRFANAENFKINEIKYVVFEEDWDLDTSTFLMKKKVNGYSLIREFIRSTRFETEEVTKSIIARYDFTKNPEKDFKKLQLLSKDVAYEVLLKNEANPEWLENIQVKHAINILLSKALSGTAQAYSFMIRDSLTPLTVSDLKIRLGEETQSYINVDETTGEEDTVSIDKKIEPNEITGVVFIEDWYIDNKTMQIYKDVKGIGLVREYVKYLDANEPEIAKTIPFIMYFSNHKKGK